MKASSRYTTTSFYAYGGTGTRRPPLRRSNAYDNRSYHIMPPYMRPMPEMRNIGAVPLNQGTFMDNSGAISRQQAFRQTYQFPRTTFRFVAANSSRMRIPRMEGVRRGFV